MLDPVELPPHLKFHAPQDDYDKTPVDLRCDRCGESFTGQAWMLRSKKEINCRNCWIDSKED